MWPGDCGKSPTVLWTRVRVASPVFRLKVIKCRRGMWSGVRKWLAPMSSSNCSESNVEGLNTLSKPHLLVHLAAPWQSMLSRQWHVHLVHVS